MANGRIVEGTCVHCGKTIRRVSNGPMLVECDCYLYCPLCGAEMTSVNEIKFENVNLSFGTDGFTDKKLYLPAPSEFGYRVSDPSIFTTKDSKTDYQITYTKDEYAMFCFRFDASKYKGLIRSITITMYGYGQGVEHPAGTGTSMSLWDPGGQIWAGTVEGYERSIEQKLEIAVEKEGDKYVDSDGKINVLVRTVKNPFVDNWVEIIVDFVGCLIEYNAGYIYTLDLTPRTYRAEEDYDPLGEATKSEATVETLFVCLTHDPPFYSTRKPMEVMLK